MVWQEPVLAAQQDYLCFLVASGSPTRLEVVTDMVLRSCPQEIGSCGGPLLDYPRYDCIDDDGREDRYVRLCRSFCVNRIV